MGRFIVQWTNKVSGDKGFVMALHNKGAYFENTPNRDKAKQWKASAKANILATLAKYCDANTYEAIDVE